MNHTVIIDDGGDIIMGENVIFTTNGTRDWEVNGFPFDKPLLVSDEPFEGASTVQHREYFHGFHYYSAEGVGNWQQLRLCDEELEPLFGGSAPKTIYWKVI